MKRKVRVKRKSGEDSPIPPFMQNYVKAVVAEAIGKISIDVVNDQLHTVRVEIRAVTAILTDLQASANLAAVNSGSPRLILQEFIENVQSSLSQNLELLKEIISVGTTDLQPENIQVVVAVPDAAQLDEAGMAAVFDALRAQVDRGSDGQDFDEEDDMIASAMENVDRLVDVDGADIRGPVENDVRSTRNTRQPQRRRRPT